MTQPATDPAVDRNVIIPQPDGVRLQADVYRPTTPGRYPCSGSKPHPRRLNPEDHRASSPCKGGNWAV